MEGINMKVFISQPMNGKTDEQIKKERKILTDKAKSRYGADVEIIDSFMEGAPHDAAPLWFLGKALQLMSQADVVYFAKDWAKARGCVIENLCAQKYGQEMGLDIVECYDYQI